MSLVWECFSPPKEDPDDPKVQRRWCILGLDVDKNLCKQSYKVFDKETTSSYKKHLDTKHPGWDERQRSSVAGHKRQKALEFPSQLEMKAKSESMHEVGQKHLYRLHIM